MGRVTDPRKNLSERSVRLGSLLKPEEDPQTHAAPHCPTLCWVLLLLVPLAGLAPGTPVASP